MKMRKIVVVAAHPDDEILGAGGTVRKAILNGDEAYAILLGEGQTSRWDTRDLADKSAVVSLHQDSYAASKVIGFREIYFESLPDNRFDSVALLDVVKIVEKHIKEIRPDVVYTHHSGDLNIDHRITNEAVLTATRPISGYSVREIYGFETVSSTEWNFGNRKESFFPSKYVDVTETFEVKCKAMEQYHSELCDFPHPRSLQMLKALAQVRGGTVGVPLAESFEVIRIVD
jgi:LmbE family N-acetylglucosaminyl deacetylase